MPHSYGSGLMRSELNASSMAWNEGSTVFPTSTVVLLVVGIDPSERVRDDDASRGGEPERGPRGEGTGCVDHLTAEELDALAALPTIEWPVDAERNGNGSCDRIGCHRPGGFSPLSWGSKLQVRVCAFEGAGGPKEKREAVDISKFEVCDLRRATFRVRLCRPLLWFPTISS